MEGKLEKIDSVQFIQHITMITITMPVYHTPQPRSKLLVASYQGINLLQVAHLCSRFFTYNREIWRETHSLTVIYYLCAILSQVDNTEFLQVSSLFMTILHSTTILVTKGWNVLKDQIFSSAERRNRNCFEKTWNQFFC